MNRMRTSIMMVSPHIIIVTASVAATVLRRTFVRGKHTVTALLLLVVLPIVTTVMVSARAASEGG